MTITRTILLAFMMLAGLGSYKVGDADAAPLHQSEGTFHLVARSEGIDTGNLSRDPCFPNPENCKRVERGFIGSMVQP